MNKYTWICTLIIPGLLLLSGTDYKKAGKMDSVKDYDGNVYHPVKIGNQVWMVENLKTTSFRNGDPISQIRDDREWSLSDVSAYCNYDNDEKNVSPYGRLYNSQAVKDKRNLAPPGWRIPTRADWKILQDYLGGAAISGGKLKETGTQHWVTPNIGADNSSGFLGVPGGFRFRSGPFGSIGFAGYFWSSDWTKLDGSEAGWFRLVTSSAQSINHNDYSEASGFSVRCIKEK